MSKEPDLSELISEAGKEIYQFRKTKKLSRM